MEAVNRRAYSRVPFKAAITLRFADSLYEHCETSDLSLKGVSVHGVTGRRIGEPCEVELYLIGSTSNLHLNMKGEVVRVRKDGLALRFFAIDLDSFIHLKNIITHNLGDQDQVEEEFSHHLEATRSID